MILMWFINCNAIARRFIVDVIVGHNTFAGYKFPGTRTGATRISNVLGCRLTFENLQIEF